jgi:hypothetical protein
MPEGAQPLAVAGGGHTFADSAGSSPTATRNSGSLGGSRPAGSVSVMLSIDSREVLD